MRVAVETTMGVPVRKETFGPIATRRLNVNLPVRVVDELEEIAHNSGKTMTEVVRAALGLVKVAQDVSDNDQKLVIANKDGKPIKEIILPK
jgi:hypothetical protein